MEWKEEDDGCLPGVEEAFTILHNAPVVPTARQAKSKKEQGPVAEDLARKQLLAAHPALYAGEPEEYRLRRADAMQACWQALSSRIQATLDGTDLHVFQELLSFAKARHRGPSEAGGGGGSETGGLRRLPTALVLAGGVNSADHTQTFPSLVAHLKQQGLYVALLQPHSFGRVPGEAINAILRQFSGLDTQAQHAEALLAWYRDEVGDPTLAAAPESSLEPSAAATSAAAGQQGPEEAPTQQQGQQQAGGRQLRPRALPAAAAAAERRSERQQSNLNRPLVIIVEGTEILDAPCLRDVVLTLSQLHSQLPVTLVLGLTTAEGALHEMLSSEITDRCMDCRSFKLASAMSRMNRVVSEVLLGGAGAWPGLAFEAGVVGALLEKFFTHYYSTGVLKQGLQLAAIEHFRSQPASFLAGAALEGEDNLREACTNLPSAVSAEVRKSGGRGGAQLAELLLEALAGWLRWSVALRWVVAAAQFVGLAKGDKGEWQFYRVYQDGLDPKGFASTATGKKLGELERKLRALAPEQVCQLAAELELVVDRTEGAGAALKEELQQLQELKRETAQPQEQGQAAAGAGPAGPSLDVPAGGEGAGPEGSGDAAAVVAEAAAPLQGSDQAKPAASRPAKREVYYSKASRRQALVANAAKAAAGSKGTAAAAAERNVKNPVAPGAKLAAWLLGVARRDALAAPPSNLPGAEVFTCRGAGALKCLSAMPRQAIHSALAQPHQFLEGLQEQVGCDASSEDACLAYSLFDQDPICTNVADWFHAFCEVHATAAEQGRKKGRKAAVKRKKKAAEAAEGEAGEAGGEEQDRRRQQRELAARFSQATAELQLVGLIKPAKRRRGDFVQRVAHMPAEAD